MVGDGPDSDDVPTPISQFIRRRLADEGWEIADVVRPPDGKRRGGPARSTLNHYLDPTAWLRTTLRPQTVEELAHGLQVSPRVIESIADASRLSNKSGAPTAGIVVPVGESAYLLRLPPDASDADRRRAMRLAQAAIDAYFSESE